MRTRRRAARALLVSLSGIVVCTGGPSLQAQRRQAAPAPQPAIVQAQPATRSTAVPAREILDKYCVTCHNVRLKTAGLQLDTLDVDHVGADARLWEKVVAKLRTKDMPPPGRPRPDPPTYDALATRLEDSL